MAQGQTHTLAREFFLGMSPEWAESKTRKQIDAWAEANIAWLNNRFGKERVKFAVLHLDEQTPHIAAYVAPLKADPKGRGNGWTLSDRALGLGGNKAALSLLQDEYAEAMRGFELRRGLKGSKATHRTTAQWRAQMAQPLDKPIKLPKIETPTLSDRIDIEAYGKRVGAAAAKAVFQQMKPHHQQAKEQAQTIKRQGEEMDKLRALVERMRPLADMLQALLEAALGFPIVLNTVQGQHDAHTAAKALLEALASTTRTAPPEPTPEAPRIEETKRSARSPNRKPRAPRPAPGAGLSR